MKLSKFLPLCVLLFLVQVSLAQDPDRILVISGGGARGAWGGGLAQTLVQDSNYHYKAVVGTSTGSLLAPLIALEDFNALKEGYTTITDKDIFNVRPFKTSGDKAGELKGLQAFWRILIGKRTLGESKRLRKTIRRFYTEAMFDELQRSGRSQVATVTNITKDTVEYKSSDTLSYDQMVDWMWASANQPVFMSLYKTRTEQADGSTLREFFVDGGIKEAVPFTHGIELACEHDAKYIDVIVHSTLSPDPDLDESGGVMKLLGRTIKLFLTEIRQNDLVAAKRQSNVVESIEEGCEKVAADETITITYYFMPKDDYNVIPNELLFNQDQMNDLWDLGRAHPNKKVTDEERKNLRIQVTVPKVQLCRGELFK